MNPINLNAVCDARSSVVVAYDLGTSTGYAIRCDGVLASAGTLVLATAKDLRAARKLDEGLRKADPRVVALYAAAREQLGSIERAIETAPTGTPIPDLHVAWEDVQFSTSTAQTQLWASFRTVLWLALEKHTAWLRHPVPVGTLKKYATGSGNADKDRMAAALRARLPAEAGWPGGLDDNAIDAIWLSHLVFMENN